MKKFIHCVVFVILLYPLFSPFISAQIINELFPNPEGDDNNKEFVEIYSNGFVNLSGFIIGDDASNDTLVGLFYDSSSNYSLIVEEGFAYQGFNASIYSIGATIGNNLGNSEDSVFFYTNIGLLLDNFTYTTVEEDKSIERNETGFYISLVSGGTPGSVNSIAAAYTDSAEEDTHEENTDNSSDSSENSTTETNIITLENALPDTVYTNQEITSGFRIENNQDENINVTLFYTLAFNYSIILSDTIFFENINSYKTADTVSFILAEEGNYTLCGNATTTIPEENLSDNVLCTPFSVIDASNILCDRNLSIFLNQTFYPNKKSVPFDFIVDGDYAADNFPFIISYAIEEFLGETVKSEKNTSTTTTKHWTPDIESLYGVYFIAAKLIETTCNDTNTSNNKATAFFIVENNAQKESMLSIDHIYRGNDGVIKTGELFRTKIEGYTGNLSGLSSSEKTIEIYVENKEDKKVSETSKITIDDSFTSFTTTVPIILDYSCSSYPTEETYTVIAEGPFSTAKEEITVAGIASGLCTSTDDGEYQNQEFTFVAYANSTITTNITIMNTDSEKHTYSVSSKLYKGSTTYNGDTFANEETMTLDAGDEKKISLKNEIPYLETGMYKTKISIKKDEQTTLREFSSEIYIIGEENNEEDIASEVPKIIFLLPVGNVVDKSIPLFSQIQGNGTYTFLLESSLERLNITETVHGSTTVFFHPTIVTGKNLFVLSVFEGDKFLTAHPLLMYANSETIESVSLLSAPKEKSSSLEKITGYTILQPIHATSSSLDIARIVGIFFFIILCICFLIFHKKLKAKIYKTTEVPQDNATDQSKSDY